MGESVNLEPEDLIAAVRARPILWDKKDTECSKHKYTAAWQQVFQQLIRDYHTLSADEKQTQGKLIMKKWRNIKDQYVKTVKRSNACSQSGRKHKKYLYHHLLTFIEVNNQEETPSDYICLKKETDYYHSLDPSQNTSNGYLTDENMEYKTETLDFPEPSFSQHMLESDTAVDKFARESCEKAGPSASPRPSEMEYGLRDNRHLWFFKSVVPSLVDFDDDETLQFQSTVINTIQNIKKSRKPPS